MRPTTRSASHEAVARYDEAVPFLISEVPGFAGHVADLRESFGDDVGAHVDGSGER
jgi:hypothetical protein